MKTIKALLAVTSFALLAACSTTSGTTSTKAVTTARIPGVAATVASSPAVAGGLDRVQSTAERVPVRSQLPAISRN